MRSGRERKRERERGKNWNTEDKAKAISLFRSRVRDKRTDERAEERGKRGISPITNPGINDADFRCSLCVPFPFYLGQLVSFLALGALLSPALSLSFCSPFFFNLQYSSITLRGPNISWRQSLRPSGQRETLTVSLSPVWEKAQMNRMERMVRS